MGNLVKYVYGTEAQILALTPADSHWYDKGFYYPSDKNYFFQALDGVMKKYGDGDPAVTGGIGVMLNDKVIGGIKIYLESPDILTIPEYFDYTTFFLHIDGSINCNGQINIM
jgi:hypothetical protein